MGCRYLWETLMSFMKTILGSAAAAALSATAALADPAIIFDLGGKFDKSFNEAAFLAPSAGPTKPADHFARSSCNPKPSANRPCAALLKRAQTRSSWPVLPLPMP